MTVFNVIGQWVFTKLFLFTAHAEFFTVPIVLPAPVRVLPVPAKVFTAPGTERCPAVSGAGLADGGERALQFALLPPHARTNPCAAVAAAGWGTDGNTLLDILSFRLSSLSTKYSSAKSFTENK